MNINSFFAWGIIPPVFTYLGLWVWNIGGSSCIWCWYPTLIVSIIFSSIVCFGCIDWNKIPKLATNEDAAVEIPEQDGLEAKLVKKEDTNVNFDNMFRTTEKVTLDEHNTDESMKNIA